MNFGLDTVQLHNVQTLYLKSLYRAEKKTMQNYPVFTVVLLVQKRENFCYMIMLRYCDVFRVNIPLGIRAPDTYSKTLNSCDLLILCSLLSF